MPPQPQDGHLQVGELRLHYVQWGDASAPPMVLLHGLQDCARSWDHFASAMCHDYNVVALDHRGHGDSEWAPPETHLSPSQGEIERTQHETHLSPSQGEIERTQHETRLSPSQGEIEKTQHETHLSPSQGEIERGSRYRLDDYVADVEALVETLSLRDIVLVGHSAGGRNAFLYTVRHPETVRALVIVDIDPDAANPESASMFRRYHAESDEWGSLDAVIERLRSRQPNSTDEMLAHQARHMTRPGPSGKRVWKRDHRLVEAYERPDLWAEWSRIECPTLIARGRQSNLLTHEVAVRMREAIPRARLAELEGGGHWFYQELPGPFEATMRWFLG